MSSAFNKKNRRYTCTMNIKMVFNVMSILLLLHMIICCNGGSKSLVWFQNKEGLFSQLLQLRVMTFVARDALALELVVPNLFTTHMNKTALSMCEIFRMPNDVRCVPTATYNVSMCRATGDVIRRVYYARDYDTRFSPIQRLLKSEIDLCYRMTVPFLGGETRRDAFLRAISFSTPRFEFHSSFREAFRAYKKGLLQQDLSYTVVHWRRGDQLSSRCLQGKDNSVNCRSAAELVSLVREYSNDTEVYVATNDLETNSTDIQVLTTNGFKIFNASLAGGDASSVTAFVVDVRLMLDANTFLGWGVSIINDIVEHERMLRNKSFCVAKDENVTYPTWCWLQEERMKVHTAENNGVRELSNRELALHSDLNMTVNPLLISAYNISNMPVYRAEVQKNAHQMKRPHKEVNNSSSS